MTKLADWGSGRRMSVAVLGLGLVLLRCGSSDEPAGGGAGGTGTAGAGHAGSNAAGAPHASSGTAGESDAGAAGASDGGASNTDESAGAGAGGADESAGAGGAPAALTLGFVFDAQTLPTAASKFALDLDGNGMADNAYLALVVGLATLGYPEQSVADAETAAGRGLQLARLTVDDSNLVKSVGASLDLSRAVAHAAPVFTGAGSFAVDGTAPSATLPGEIAGGVFSSTLVQIGEKPPKVLLRLPFAGPVDVPVSVFSVTAHVAANGLTIGQLNGAISATDVDATIPKTLAVAVNSACPATDATAACISVWALYDANHDKSVSEDEVRANVVLKSLFASDVKVFDAQGKYAPNPSALTKDALSVGIGFSAVKAAITQ